MKEYDVIIIGGGPAGLTAGLYASRDRLNTLLLEKGFLGGLIAMAEHVENFPGFPDGIGGFELSKLIEKQATKFGLNTIMADVTAVELKGEQKIVKTSDGDFTAKALIIASGSERSKLGVPGEAEFTGRGVSYCATCDAAFFADVPVAVVGGGNAAISEALHLAKVASKVTIIHRRNELRAAKIEVENATDNPKIAFLLETVVDKIEGTEKVSNLQVRNLKTGKVSKLAVAGVFVSIGQKPNTEFLKGIVPLTPDGHVITDDRMETEIPGVFAAGDVRRNSGMQSITAAGEGAAAAIYAHKYLAGK
jgi:thioredoxin reductase (NADPH)